MCANGLSYSEVIGAALRHAGLLEAMFGADPVPRGEVLLGRRELAKLHSTQSHDRRDRKAKKKGSQQSWRPVPWTNAGTGSS